MTLRRGSAQRDVGRPRGALVASLLVVALLVLSACRLDVAVTVDVASDGSGIVSVGVAADDELLAKVPGGASVLAIDDLKAAGWTTTPATKEADGRTWVRASKPFANPEQAAAVVAEVSGSTGLLDAVKIVAARNEVRTVWTFTASSQLQGGLGAFSDSALVQALGGTPALQAQVAASGVPLDQALRYEVSVKLPGVMTATSPGEVTDGRATWVPPVDGRRTDLTATGIEPIPGLKPAPTPSGSSWARWALVAYLVALLGFVVLGAVGLLRARRRPRRPRSPVSSDLPG